MAMQGGADIRDLLAAAMASSGNGWKHPRGRTPEQRALEDAVRAQAEQEAEMARAMRYSRQGYGRYPMQEQANLQQKLDTDTMEAMNRGMPKSGGVNPLADNQMSTINELRKEITKAELDRAGKYSDARNKIGASPNSSEKITADYQPTINQLYGDLWRAKEGLTEMTAPPRSAQGDITVSAPQEMGGKISGRPSAVLSKANQTLLEQPSEPMTEEATVSEPTVEVPAKSADDELQTIVGSLTGDKKKDTNAIYAIAKLKGIAVERVNKWYDSEKSKMGKKRK